MLRFLRLRPILISLALGAVLAACGARSSLDPPRGPGGGGGGGGGGNDAGVVTNDGRVEPVRDGGPIRRDGGGVVLDRGVPQPDLRPPSCLPAPPNVINGAYFGSYKGKINCQPLIGNSGFNGDLKLSLGMTDDPEHFDVKGSMVGTVSGIDIEGQIAGSLFCTTLEAKIPSISVQGGMLPIQLDGQIFGELSVGSTGRLTLDGDFEIVGQNFQNCAAKGSWFAANKPAP